MFFTLLLSLTLIQNTSAFLPTTHNARTVQRTSQGTFLMSSNQEPTTDKMQAVSNAKKVGAALGVLGLVFGKKAIDGPGKCNN